MKALIWGRNSEIRVRVMKLGLFTQPGNPNPNLGNPTSIEANRINFTPGINDIGRTESNSYTEKIHTRILE